MQEIRSCNLPRYSSPRISSELPDCANPLSFDTYSRCSMGCRYCFSNSQKDVNPHSKKAPFQAVDPKYVFGMIDGTTKSKENDLLYNYFFRDKFLLHWGGLADAFCHYEKKYGVSYTILEGLLDREYPTLFSSKGPVMAHDKFVHLFEKHKAKNAMAFQFSIVTADDKLAKKVEPGVPTPTERFGYMKMLSDMGYWCILRLRPFIIGVTDHSLEDIMEKAYAAGAKAISTEFYALDTRCIGNMRKATIELGKIAGHKDVFDYYRKLSPSERGGYMRLNRLVKEPYMKYLYKFCIDHNMIFSCSDPDFKELGTSPCCCGMPPIHPTASMNNWSKDQLTAHIIQARMDFHTKGIKTPIKFNDVYSRRDWIFDDITLSHIDIGCMKYIYSQRKHLTIRHILQTKWNNLNSYANPAAYFHGKIMPVGLDEEKENFVYHYIPHPYEKRWIDEGIPLDVEWVKGRYIKRRNKNEAEEDDF